MEENQSKIVFLNGEKATLADGEAVVSNNQFGELVYRQYEEKVNAAHEANNQALAEKLYKSMDLVNQVWQGGYWKETSDGKGEMFKYSEAEMIQKINQVITAIKKDGINLKLAVRLFNDQNQSVYGDTKEFTIVGIALKASEQDQDKLVLSDAVATQLWDEQKVNVEYYSISETKYKNEKDAMYGYVFVPYDHSIEKTNLFWDLYDNENYAEDDSRIKPAGLFIQKLEMVDELVKTLSQVFLYVGLAMAVFSALLLSNFISVSISQKKKEIGILRAVGARSLDVFKIFFSESFVIAVICVVIAIFGSSTICNILNQNVAAELGASLFVFGIPSFAVLIFVALATTIIATFLPVWNAAKKKPVDSIRAL
jgi:ABC-type antimicrobial peptide transport system permease subunit